MTSTSNYVKFNAIPLTTLLAVLSFIIYQSRRQAEVDTHIKDKQIHMPFEKKIEVFVPRVELNSRMENIEKTLVRIENKIDKETKS